MTIFLKRLLIFGGLALSALLPSPLSAEEEPSVEPRQETFRATVLKVIEESAEEDVFYQDLKLEGKTDPYKNRQMEYLGHTKEIGSPHRFKNGDAVFVSVTEMDGEEIFIVTDRSRLAPIYALSALFALVVLAIGRKRGLRALLALSATFLVIIGFVVPQILSGAEPVRTAVGSAIIIVVLSMVIVYGWTKKSKIAIVGMLVGVFITALIAGLFTRFASLTGSAAEGAIFLRDYLGTGIDFRGLLLASFILGSIGILNDIAVAQTSTAQEISEANKDLKPSELYKKSMEVGIDHIASMINTLFLAYAGVSFVLLLLFGLNQPPFTSFSDVINNEMIATEIVRTLVGSIGLVLTVPITTYLAAYFYGKKT